jgi:flagellar protein FliJ
MKSHEAIIRLKTFQVEEKQRKVAQIETMIADFERIANDLDREIRVEQDRSGIHDPSHYAYPTYAKAALARRDNLKHSAGELRAQLLDAQNALEEACEERRKVELLGERDQQRERAAQDSRGSADLDSLGILRSRAALA